MSCAYFSGGYVQSQSLLGLAVSVFIRATDSNFLVSPIVRKVRSAILMILHEPCGEIFKVIDLRFHAWRIWETGLTIACLEKGE